MDVRTWLTELVAFYRRFGFFGAYRKASDEDAVRQLVQLQAPRGGFEPGVPRADLQALRWDTTRVWTEDPSLQITPGSRAYVKTLAEWSRISRGAFLPRGLTESWDQNRIWLDLAIDGEPAGFEALDAGDNLIDLEMVKDVNNLIKHPYYRLEIIENDKQIVSIMVLTAEEKIQIERARGLPFHVHDVGQMMHALSTCFDGQSLPPNPVRRTYVGVYKDKFERAIGKLTMTLEDTRVMGRYQSNAEDWKQDLNLTGYYDPSAGTLSGTMLGAVGVLDHAAQISWVPKSYLGTWKGNLSPGAQTMYGTWVGWFVRDRADETDQAPAQEDNFSGSFGLIDEKTLRSSRDPLLARVDQWMLKVWQAPSLIDSPLTYLDVEP
ncbi:MAG: hypothetical protein HY319_23730 [Armatimonadetes bacterium]|nr:hypothetical protein [Armatimonadota bacterium]